MNLSKKTILNLLIALFVLLDIMVCFYGAQKHELVDGTAIALTLVFIVAYLILFGKVTFFPLAISVLTFLISIVAIGLITKGNILYIAIAGYFFYFIAVCVLHNTYKKREARNGAYKVLLLPPFIMITLPVLIANSNLHFLPFATLYLIGAFSGLLVCKIRNTLWGVSLAVLFSTLCYFSYSFIVAGRDGQRMELQENRYLNLTFNDRDNITQSLSTLPQKIVIMDFWFYGCLPCIEGFPKLQRLTEQYKNDPDILIASFRYEDEPLPPHINGFDYLSKYSFKHFDLNTTSQNEWGISTFPTVLVFDKNRHLRYKGQLVHHVLSPNDMDRIIAQLKSE